MRNRNRNTNRTRNGNDGLTAAVIRNQSPYFLAGGVPTYNQTLNTCEITGVEHCELWNIDEPFPLRFKPADEGEDLIDCEPVLSFVAASGSNATTLVRPSGSFGSAFDSRLVHNVTTGTTAVIVSHSGGTATTLGGAFASGDSVRIYKFKLSNTIDVADLAFVNNLPANEPKIQFFNFGGRLRWESDNTGTFGVNPQYRFALVATDYAFGALNIIGFTTNAPASQAESIAGTLQAAGDFEYLMILGGGLSPVIEPPAGNSFTGTLDMCPELYKIKTDYWYSINGQYSPFTATIKGLPIMAEHFIDMTEVENLDECRNQICVYEEVENELCATFQEVTSWVTYPDSSGSEPCLGDRESELQAIELPCPLSVGATYNFKITLTGVGDVQVTIADALLGNQNNSPALVAPGTYEFSITATMPPNIAPFLYVRALSGGTEACFTLEMQKEGAQIIATPFMCSECYAFKPLDECAMELNWSNNTGAFGMVKNTVQYAYPPARLRNAKVEQISYDEEKGTDSIQRNFYSNARKTEELSIAIVPPFVHNYMAVAMMHRIFNINGVQYVALEAYEPDYSDDHESARAIVKVAQSDQDELVNPL